MARPESVRTRRLARDVFARVIVLLSSFLLNDLARFFISLLAVCLSDFSMTVDTERMVLSLPPFTPRRRSFWSCEVARGCEGCSRVADPNTPLKGSLSHTYEREKVALYGVTREENRYGVECSMRERERERRIGMIHFLSSSKETSSRIAFN